MNQILKVVIVISAIAGILIGMAIWYWVWLKSLVATGRPLIVYESVHKQNDLYVVESAKNGILYITNASVIEIEQFLNISLEKKLLMFGALVNDNNFVLLWVNGKTFLTEQEALTAIKQQAGSFTNVYNGLGVTQKNCVKNILGDRLISDLDNPLNTIPTEKLEEYGKCFQLE